MSISKRRALVDLFAGVLAFIAIMVAGYLICREIGVLP